MAVLLLSAVLFFSSLNYAWQANVNSMTMYYTNRQTTQYFSSMVTRIRSVDGYAQNCPLAIIGNQFHDNSYYNYVSEQSGAVFHGNIMNHLQSYSWRSWLRYYLAFSQPEATQEQTEALQNTREVRDMPCYPDSGSIRIIDGIIVLKLENPDQA